MEDVFADAPFEMEEQDHRKNCSIGFMFISMLHLANEENGKLEMEKNETQIDVEMK